MAEPQAAQAGGAQMPKIDFAKLDEFMKGRGIDLKQKQAEAQAQKAESMPKGNPDAVESQTAFREVKDGDSYTDENGQKWEYSVFEYDIVPEDTKDEEVDELEGELEGDDAGEGEGTGSGLEDALDIALQILNEEEEGDKGSGEAATQDEATQLVMDAVEEVLGVAEDGANHPELNGRREVYAHSTKEGYSEPKGLTWKQGGGWEVDDPSELSETKQRRKEFEQTPDGKYRVKRDKSTFEHSAKQKAKLTNRRPVAATWEDCRAKDKARCRWHGAAYMRHQLEEVLKANGIPLGKYGVEMDDDKVDAIRGPKDPIGYRLIFATPEGTPLDTKTKIAREFFAKNPAVMFKEGGKNKLPSDAHDDTVFYIRDADMEDMPIDAPTQEDYDERHYTEKEAEHGASAARRSGTQWWSGDESRPREFFDMLREKPTNIVELNEDIIRYAQACPEYLPEGVTMEGLMADYEAFKKANAEKDGAEAFLMHGMMVEDAEGLVKDATGKVSEAAKAYYAISQKIYDRGAQVFRSVEEGLWKKYRDMMADGRSLWSYQDLVKGGSVKDAVAYAGTAFQGKRPFPMIGWNKAYDEELQEVIADIRKGWQGITGFSGRCFDACEKRSPLELSRALTMMEGVMTRAKMAVKELGDIQDEILRKASPELQKALKFKPVDKAKPANEETDDASGEGAAEPETPVAPTEEPAKPAKSTKKRKPKPKADASSGGADASGQKEDTENKDTGTDGGNGESTGVEKQETDPYIGQTGDAILGGIKLSDSPTIEEATEANKALSALERRLRGLANVVEEVKDKKDRQVAESEIAAVKSAMEKFQKDAVSKGIFFAKDQPKYNDDGESDSKPMDLPTNFRIESIKGADGKRTRVPYAAPAQGEMDAPVPSAPSTTTNAGSSGSEANGSSDGKPAKKVKRLSDKQLSAAFDKYSGKIGALGNGKTLDEIIDKDGFEMHYVTHPDTGKLMAFLVVKDKDTGAIDKSKGVVNLADKFNQVSAGEGNEAYQRFLQAVERRVNLAKKAREDEDYLNNLLGGNGPT